MKWLVGVIVKRPNDSINKGKCRELMELIAQQDPVNKHLQMFQDASKNVIYMSPGAENELITLIGQRLHSSLFSKVNEVIVLSFLNTTVSSKDLCFFFLMGLMKWASNTEW